MIISCSNEVVATTQEFHVRFQRETGDVAFWDNGISVRTFNDCEYYVYTDCGTRIILLLSGLRGVEDVPLEYAAKLGIPFIR